ncbi:hypothetical protein JXA12_05250 [Candidatus Woesearchaeota archaeon]|nr:hypothetical protein [Candidatus Woesearchaeota archaeon]
MQAETHLEGFFSRNKPLRVLIEGCFQPGRENINLDVGEYVIPETTTSIQLGITGYDLDLVARLDGQESMEFLSQAREGLLLDYNNLTRIRRPRCLLADDGRLYYDRRLLRERPAPAASFVRFLHEQHREGRGFHDLYELVKRQRGI